MAPRFRHGRLIVHLTSMLACLGAPAYLQQATSRTTRRLSSVVVPTRRNSGEGASTASELRVELPCSKAPVVRILLPQKVTPRPTPTLPAQKPDYASTYWYDPRIHNFGNIGLGGWFHAICAPISTAVIDQLSYSGLDVRKLVHNNPILFPPGSSKLDLCCGTGFSTPASAHGVDTSPCMVAVASVRHPNKRFSIGNAETYGDDKSYDVVSCMFATHEMPAIGRRRVLRNAMRVARQSVVVVDIDPDFEETLRAKPMEGAAFLSGEPYVLDYLRRIDDDVIACAPVRITAPGGWKVTRHRILEKHVVAWHLERIYQ